MKLSGLFFLSALLVLAPVLVSAQESCPIVYENNMPVVRCSSDVQVNLQCAYSRSNYTGKCYSSCSDGSYWEVDSNKCETNSSIIDDSGEGAPGGGGTTDACTLNMYSYACMCVQRPDPDGYYTHTGNRCTATPAPNPEPTPVPPTPNCDNNTNSSGVRMAADNCHGPVVPVTPTTVANHSAGTCEGRSGKNDRAALNEQFRLNEDVNANYSRASMAVGLGASGGAAALAIAPEAAVAYAMYDTGALVPGATVAGAGVVSSSGSGSSGTIWTSARSPENITAVTGSAFGYPNTARPTSNTIAENYRYLKGIWGMLEQHVRVNNETPEDWHALLMRVAAKMLVEGGPCK